MRTIGIIGTRRRDTEQDYCMVESVFMSLYIKGDRICSGLCPKGGDRFAVILAEKLGTPTVWFPADWKRHGRAAGFIRNTDIAETSDILIAVVAGNRSGGTEDTISKFIKFNGRECLILC